MFQLVLGLFVLALELLLGTQHGLKLLVGLYFVHELPVDLVDVALEVGNFLFFQFDVLVCHFEIDLDTF